MAEPCPTWWGDGDLGVFCDGDDVEAWWLELESRSALVDSYEATRGPNAADRARIASFRAKQQIARDVSLAGVDCEMMAAAGSATFALPVAASMLPANCVQALSEAVALSHCVIDLWEGPATSKTPKPTPPAKTPANGGKTTSPAVTADALKKPPGTTAILVAVGLISGLVAVILRGGRG